jgi:SAM-dependent methyltransferase
MLSSAVRLLFGRLPPHQPDTVRTLLAPVLAAPIPSIAETTRVDAGRQTAWPAVRLALSNELWGAGFMFPGGESEILRLTRPLGVSAAASLLIVGVGCGGPASAVTRNLGAWVTGMESDPSLLAAARGLVGKAQLGKKITLKPWDPDNPAFGTSSHHHCLALEPFHGGHPEPIVDALARALKPGGQMVITELAAPAPLNPADPTVRRWAELEHRDPLDVLAPVAVTRMLGRMGLDVRVSEDISDRHIEHALLGWRVMLRDLLDTKPTPQQAAQLVREAELWLLRRRLIRGGRLRMMRWHAISRAHSAVPG